MIKTLKSFKISMRHPMLTYVQDRIVKIKIILLVTKITAIAAVS